jgi:hypothetical protein
LNEIFFCPNATIENEKNRIRNKIVIRNREQSAEALICYAVSFKKKEK